MKNFLFWLDCTRAYSLPMSITAWMIPFALAYFDGGNVVHGLIALAGIICAHLGANLFDDVIDYKNYLKSRKEKHDLNLKKGKCRCFEQNLLTIPKALRVCLFLFMAAVIVGIFFIEIYKLPVLIIMAVTGFLCLLYPKSGYFGLSEIIIGTIFSPLLFTGVYYVMTGEFCTKLIWLSVSFALVTICLLYTDFFLDYNSDKIAGKKTIPVLTGSKENAYFFYIFVIFLIYANLFLGIHSHIFPVKYTLIFISIIPALNTIKTLQKYIDKEIKDEKDFMKAMNNVQKFVLVFAILCVISFT